MINFAPGARRRLVAGCAPPCGSPARHFRRAFLSHGSAFAGGGLNIRPPAVCLATPTLTVSGRSSAAARQTLRCGLPIVTSSGVVTIRGGVTLAAAPALARAAAVATGFRVFPNNLSQSGRARSARARPLDLQRQLLVTRGLRPLSSQHGPASSRLGTLSGSKGFHMANPRSGITGHLVTTSPSSR